MDTMKKRAWKTVIKGYLLALSIVLLVIVLLYFRTGSLASSITVGIFFALLGLRWLYSDYQRIKRESYEKKVINAGNEDKKIN
jgi:hypothetical protein